jgi:hypothetical protein
MTELRNLIFDRMSAAAPSGVWSRADFLDLGSAYAVEKVLQRLHASGQIRRPHRGLYDITGTTGLTGGMLFPPRQAFIDAIARRDRLRVVVDGMTAANDLGLTPDVPAKTVIYADTQPRVMAIHANVGEADADPVVYDLVFRMIGSRKAFWAGRPGMRIVQALAWLGKDAMDGHVAAKIAGRLRHAHDPQSIVDDLLDNLSAMPTWMHPVAYEIRNALKAR